MLIRITNRHPINRIAELTPWAYLPAVPVHADVPDHDDASTPEFLQSIIPAA